ncbi:1-acyl-glycerol-3-phosphate acyltransferase [Sulfurimonas gotlandica GD1]|uniref:1-acyl-glycerol-3-phosphate acyltransferase n=1 Tax=Sulfurimonas gotlandica (strain DSM 19862 / JCM 16533 / GD1) TaxID=929558 RepID=B6BLE9_SULGG|nr:lysophospholipid acyltransferase family protein [Sulfurimonas gotlandica]EDZ62205.1 phospholipid/glycerol acyltransferase [Sulfurimonas gotlandica GD1]EHP28604.1 1-acyl-glycerol-3-phosphate acyltransferase [Sulfurimonas gotlandica GD1]
MLKTLGKFIFMIELGYRHIKIFKRTYFHPFISLKPAYTQLSKDRQSYSNGVIEFLNIEIELIGEVPQKDKVLYAINHRSLLDIIVMEHIFSKHNKNGTWIAKQELFDAFYGDFFRYSGCISVDLENRKGLLKFFKEIKKTLSKIDDFNIYIFPEGERNKTPDILEFQSGAQKIAKANNLDVVPVFINDTLESVFKHAPYKEKKVVQVHMGDLIDHTNLENDYINFMNEAKG